ncbi:DUF6165 family protein [Ramlibacter sp. XY19]|uniref:DUF6165 family protein n=1 Tax=Ramlibacter paludis TaxID=2908000 RepID=UPI0023DB7F0D|nr:DUF6165 family protein [Ramlibacter paludis]MCG2595502.1 DUF6165 family protein [Ramlibacter paludis]
MSAAILVPVAAGELFDKKTILQIKRERIASPEQRANVERELALLAEIADRIAAGTERRAELQDLEAQLRGINEQLWDLENVVRACERNGRFDESFVASARSIYAGNDRRAAVKRQINLLLGSALIEEKSHT